MFKCKGEKIKRKGNSVTEGCSFKSRERGDITEKMTYEYQSERSERQSCAGI